MNDFFKKSTMELPSKEKILNSENKEGKSINPKKQEQKNIEKTREKIENKKKEESIDISISSMKLDEDEEQLIEDLLKEDINKINEDKNKNINVNNHKQNKGKIINEISENNIKNKDIEKLENYLNKKTLINRNKEQNNKSKEEILINQILDNYSFDKILKKCLQNNLDENKNLDNCIINLVNNIGYKHLFKILLTKFGLYDSPQESNNMSEIKPEEIEYIHDFPLNETIIKIVDIKPNSYKIKPKCNVSNNNKGLGLHLHKNKKGEIYKYLLHRVNNYKAWFYCSDRNCRGVASLELKNKKFRIKRDHTIKYNEHSFYARILPNEVVLFKYFKKIDKTEAQIIYRYDGNDFAVFY